MKKTLKNFTTLLLFALLIGLNPTKAFNNAVIESEVSICTDDDENDYEIIATE